MNKTSKYPTRLSIQLRLIFIVCIFVFCTAETMTGGPNVFGCSAADPNTSNLTGGENNQDGDPGSYLTTPTISSSSGTELSFAVTTNEVGVERTIILTFPEEMSKIASSITPPLATVDEVDWLTLNCSGIDLDVTVTSDDNATFEISTDSGWNLNEDCTLTIAKDSIQGTSGAVFEEDQVLEFTTVCSPSDSFDFTDSLTDCWIVQNDDLFDTFDASSTIGGSLTIGDALKATGENRLVMGKVISGDIDIEMKIDHVFFHDIIDDSSMCWSGEDTVGGLCVGDGDVPDPEDGIDFGNAHPYATNNFLDSFGMRFTDVDMTVGMMFIWGKHYNGAAGNITYCGFVEGEPEDAADLSNTLCDVDISESEPFYINITKDDSTGTFTAKVKSGKESYTTLGSATIPELAGEDVQMILVYTDDDELFCYSAQCRAANGSEGYVKFKSSFEINFDYIKLSKGLVENQD